MGHILVEVLLIYLREYVKKTMKIPFSTERNKGSLEKTDFRAGARKVQVSPEHFAVSESKEVPQGRQKRIKRT